MGKKRKKPDNHEQDCDFYVQFTRHVLENLLRMMNSVTLKSDGEEVRLVRSRGIRTQMVWIRTSGSDLREVPRGSISRIPSIRRRCGKGEVVRKINSFIRTTRTQRPATRPTTIIAAMTDSQVRRIGQSFTHNSGPKRHRFDTIRYHDRFTVLWPPEVK